MIDIWHIPFKNLSLEHTWILNEDECQKASAFKKEEDKRHYQLSHIYLRKILSHYFPDTKSNEWAFSFNAYGKPSLLESEKLSFYFNLSHTNKRAYIICSSSPFCGIDVEEFKKVHLDENLLDLVLAEKEKLHFKEENFLELWTLKEAYLKAIGTGLSLAMTDIETQELNTKDYKIYTYKEYIMTYFIKDNKDKQTLSFLELKDI